MLVEEEEGVEGEGATIRDQVDTAISNTEVVVTDLLHTATMDLHMVVTMVMAHLQDNTEGTDLLLTEDPLEGDTEGIREVTKEAMTKDIMMVDEAVQGVADINLTNPHHSLLSLTTFLDWCSVQSIYLKRPDFILQSECRVLFDVAMVTVVMVTVVMVTMYPYMVPGIPSSPALSVA